MNFLRYILLLSFCVGALAQNAQERAIDFLLEQRQLNLWSFDTERQNVDTRKVIQVFNKMDHAKVELAREASKLGLGIIMDGEGITIQTAVLLLLADPQSKALLELRNQDGGWGSAPGKQSNPLDTSVAIEALLDAEVDVVELERSAAYLINAVGEGGYWALSNEPSYSKLELTARVLQTLRRIEKVVDLDLATQTVMEQTATLLQSHSKPNGHYILDGGIADLKTTAEVYKALISYQQPSLLVDTYNLFLASQREDGSYYDKQEEKVYTTALILETLSLLDFPDVSGLADLAVLPQGISVSPQALGKGDNFTVSAIVFNLGQVVANNVKVSFYNGDPRLGATELYTAVVASVLPGKSKKVSYLVNGSGLTHNPNFFIHVDKGNEIAELTLANNIASKKLSIDGLEDEPEVDGVDLYINSKDITVNGQSSNGNLLLLESSLLSIGLNITNLGNQTSPVSSFTLKDGAAVIAQPSIEPLAPGESRQISLPWKPSSGLHVLSVVVDDRNVIAETKEDNNEASTTLDVVGEQVKVVAKKLVDGLEVDPPVGGYEVMMFNVVTSHSNAVVNLVIKRDGSSFQDVPVALPITGKYQWNTAAATPGDYTVTAYFRSADDDTLLDTAQDSFTLIPSTKLRSITPYLSEDLLVGGEIKPITVQLTLANGSNIDSTWNLSWRAEDAQGNTVRESSENMTVDIAGTQMSKTVELSEAVTGDFDQGGEYSLIVTASREGSSSVEGKARFSLIAPFDLTVTNSLQPNEVSPLGRARIKTELKLSVTGGEGDLTLPYSVKTLEQSPKGEIADLDTEELNLEVNDVLNIIGRQVPNGTRVAVYIPYGSLKGGEDSALNRFGQQNTQFRFYSVVNGKLNISYSPRGGVLTAGQASVSVMEFYQIFEDEIESGLWQGKLIGTHEVYLRGN